MTKSSRWAAAKAALLATLVAVTLAACTDPSEIEGEVVGKDYSPAYSIPIVTQVCNGQGACTPVVSQQYVPESYDLAVRVLGGDVESFGVDQGTYELVEIGDKWDHGKVVKHW